MDASDKPTLYRTALNDLDAVLAGIADDVAAMATCASLLHGRIAAASWTGFYRVVAPRLLRVGPYQGPIGCLEIEFGRGVCGTAASTRRTQLVPDVDRFPGHIACDAAARSEIVVPLFRGGDGGELVAVLDIDSHQLAAFDDADRAGLEAVAGRLSRYLGAHGPAAAP